MTISIAVQGSTPIIKNDVAQCTTKEVETEKNYWNNFYGRFNISHPSQFCVMTAIEGVREQPIIE